MEPKEIKILKRHDALYDKGVPVITDEKYDKLRKEAKKKYPAHPYFKEVGAPVVETDNSVKLPFVMGSLDKVGTENAESWARGKNFICASEKVDGVSLLCKWVNGKLSYAYLRGDGETGHDVTCKAKHFVKSLDVEGTVVLRSDATLIGDSYLELGYKNRRNGTAGLLGRKEAVPEKLSFIVPIFYEVVEAPVDNIEEYERFVYIRSLGLKTPDFILLRDNNIVKPLSEMLHKAKKHNLYDVDGLVLCKNLSDRENVLIPKNKVAFKVAGEAVNVIVLGIEWNTSRTGKIIPVILLEPTKIGGVEVSRVTGFNAKHIVSDKIGKGAIVSVIRSGDVIPHITSVVKTSDNIVLPEKCPKCGYKTGWEDDNFICLDPDCFGVTSKKIAYFYRTLGVKGLTYKTVEMHNITTIEEMLSLRPARDRYGYSYGRRYNSTLKLSKRVKRSINGVTPLKLLTAFGIRGLSKKNAEKVLSKYKFDEIFHVKDVKELGIGKVTGENFISTIGKYKSLYETLKLSGMKFKDEAGSLSGGKLSGLKFAMTGTLPRRRDDLIDIIESNGGTTGTITRNTNYLICRNPGSTYPSDKQRKARAYGVREIDWYEFQRMLNG